jgi:predicted esterase
MAEELDKNGIRYAFKQAKTGGHGIGLADQTEAAGWLEEAIAFWRNE